MTTTSPTNVTVKLVPGSVVTVYQADGVTPIEQTMYSTLTAGGILTNPLTANGQGFLEAYTERPEPVVLSSADTIYRTAFEPYVDDVPLRPQLPTNAMAPPWNLKGDGVTDETATLQAFFSDVSTGGAYELPVGTYLISSTLTVSNADSVAIRGHPGTVIHQTTAGQKGLQLTNCSDVLIDNINMVGPGTPGVAAAIPKTEFGIHIVSGDTVVVRDCTVTAFGAKGIQVDASTATVTGCVVTGTGQEAARQFCTGITVFGEDSSILNCRVDNYENGMSCQSTSHGTLIDNWVNQTQPPTVVDNGIYASGAQQIIQGNHVTAGIKSSFTNDRSIISSNVCTGGGGIWLTHGKGVVVANNTIDGGGTLSMGTDGGGTLGDPLMKVYSANIHHNTIRNSALGAPSEDLGGHLGAIWGACADTTIEANLIEFSADHGICLYDASTQDMPNLTISRNTFRKCSFGNTGVHSAIKLGGGWAEGFPGLRVFGNVVESWPAVVGAATSTVAPGSVVVHMPSVDECAKYVPGDAVTGAFLPAGTRVERTGALLYPTGSPTDTGAPGLVLSLPSNTPSISNMTITKTAQQVQYIVDLSQANNGDGAEIFIGDDNVLVGALSSSPAQRVAYGTSIVRRDQSNLRHSAVAHGMTSQADTDVFERHSSLDATLGGSLVQGFTEGTTALHFQANATTDSTTRTGLGHIVFDTRTRVPASSTVQAPAANTNLLVVRSSGTNVHIVDAEGDIFAPTGHTTITGFDEYADAELVRLVDMLTSPDQIVRSEFDQFIRYHQDDLERLKILAVDDGAVFVNVTQLQRVHNGALWQTHTALQRALARIDSLEQRLSQLGAPS